MITDTLLSAIVSTSDFAVLRSVNDLFGDKVPEDTMTVLVTAIQDARKRLNTDLFSSVDGSNVEIDNSVDPIVFISELPESVYDKMTSDMESGWSSKILSGSGNVMANVGFNRKIAAYNTKPSELFDLLDTLFFLSDEKPDTEEAVIKLAKTVNLTILAMCAPAGKVREALLEGAAS